MKITDIRTLVLVGPDAHGIGGQSRDWHILLVRIDTDAGLYGLGEAAHFQSQTLGVRQLIMGKMKEYLVGKDPFAIRPFVTDMLYGGLPPHQPSQSASATPFGPVAWAVSGVEMALCDLVGKALNTPVYNLLGGKYRDRLLVYLDRSTPTELDDLDAWRRLAVEAREQGFTDIKFDIDYMATDQVNDAWNRTITLPQINRMVERLTAVREAVGWDMEISVDGHMQYDVPSAIRLIQELAPLRLKWFEDPTPIVNPDACAAIREKSAIPICVGEVFVAEQFRLFIDRGACDIIHPDILFSGGLYETRKIADYADLNYIPMAMHNNSCALGIIACAHVAAASPNFIGLEYHFHDAPWIGGVVDRGGRPLFENGHIHLTDEPGLGVVLNEAVCQQYLAPGETMF
jgi:L-alanine-DL-glutamate epimerase-like enolase superfamily enzyme